MERLDENFFVDPLPNGRVEVSLNFEEVAECLSRQGLISGEQARGFEVIRDGLGQWQAFEVWLELPPSSAKFLVMSPKGEKGAGCSIFFEANGDLNKSMVVEVFNSILSECSPEFLDPDTGELLVSRVEETKLLMTATFENSASGKLSAGQLLTALEEISQLSSQERSKFEILPLIAGDPGSFYSHPVSGKSVIYMATREEIILVDIVDGAEIPSVLSEMAGFAKKGTFRTFYQALVSLK